MKFKPGDIVIKKTGGNKMTIDSFKDDIYKCIWFIESKLNESEFNEEEIVTLDEYKKFLKIEERDDKIKNLLK